MMPTSRVTRPLILSPEGSIVRSGYPIAANTGEKSVSFRHQRLGLGNWPTVNTLRGLRHFHSESDL
jgi:hypothetical protein